MEDYKKITIDSYNKNAKELSEKFKKLLDLKRRDEFSIFEELISGKKILDMGCGSGDHSAYFKERGFDVVSIDLSGKMIKLCKDKGLDAKIMDIEDLQFSNNEFDGVWAVKSLLHVPREKIKKVINDIYDILKKDGVLYVCVKEGQGERFIEDAGGKRYFVFWQEDDLLNIFDGFFDLIMAGKKKLGKTVFLEFLLKKKEYNYL